MGCGQPLTRKLYERRRLATAYRDPRSQRNCRQRREQPPDVGLRSHGDAQIVRDARLGEMAHQHRALAQAAAKSAPAALGMAGEDEIGGRRQDLEAEPRKPCRQNVRGSRMTVARRAWKYASSSTEAIAPAWAGRPSG